MIVGIEIGSDSLRAAAFKRFAAGRKPDRTAEVPFGLPSEGDDFAKRLTAAIRLLFKELSADRPTVAVAIPSAWCAYRVASFPYRAPTRVEGTLRYALEGRLPQPIESYVTEPLTDILPAGADGARLLVAACPSDRMRLLLDAFHAVGVEPCIVQPAAVSLARAALRRSADATGQGGGTWLVRLAGSDCEAVLACDGAVRACHVLRVGGLSLERAEDVKKIAQRLRFIVRANRLGEAASDYDRVALLARPEVNGSLAESLERHLGTPVSAPAAGGPDSKWAVVCDMAAQAAKRRHSAVNLRRGELSYRPFARRAERRIVAALALAVAIVCMIGGYTARRIFQARRDLRDTLVRQRQALAEVSSEVAVPIDDLYDLTAVVANALKEAGAVERTVVVSCIPRWWDVMHLATRKVTFDLIDISEKRIKIEAVALDGGAAAAFQRALQSLPGFMPNATSKMVGLPNGRISLKMELRYR